MSIQQHIPFDHYGEKMQYKIQRHLDYRDTVRFHGHDGPFLALGYRLGRFLVRELKPKGIMGLRVRMRTRIQKPYTCVLDGLQCASRATMGKGNIAVISRAKGDIWVYAQSGKRSVRCRMSRLAWDICLQADDLEKAARRVLRTPINSLWHMQK